MNVSISIPFPHLLFSPFYSDFLLDERFEEAYSNMVEGLTEIMVDWNETLAKLPGFECYENRPIGAPVSGQSVKSQKGVNSYSST